MREKIVSYFKNPGQSSALWATALLQLTSTAGRACRGSMAGRGDVQADMPAVHPPCRPGQSGRHAAATEEGGCSETIALRGLSFLLFSLLPVASRGRCTGFARTCTKGNRAATTRCGLPAAPLLTETGALGISVHTRRTALQRRLTHSCLPLGTPAATPPPRPP